MGLTSNLNQIAFVGKYGIDKVIFKKTGSINVPQAASMSDSVTITIPHGLGYAPLCLGQFSEDNFATGYEFGNPPYAFIAAFGTYGPRIDGVVESNSTNIMVTLINFDTTRVLYYRVVALIPTGITSSPVMSLASRSDILFSAADNYLKIAVENKGNYAFDGIHPQTIIINHGLGYRPMALAFSQQGGVMRRVGFESQIGVTGLTNIAAVDSSNLYIYADDLIAETLTFHWVIYYDN